MELSTIPGCTASEIPTWSSQQSQDAPLSQETPVRKDRKKWNPADDEVLISAWLNTSKDPIIGNQQTVEIFWQRVGEYYAESPHAIANGEHGLNINCKQRWFKINDFTNKFCGAYANAERLNSSGHSETDVLNMAHDIYVSDHKTKFTMNHCWCLLRFEQKFLDLNKINNLTPKGRTKRRPVEEASQSEEKLQKLGILDTLLAKPEPLSAVDQVIKDKIVAQYFLD
ncbi:glutathione S-transferase T3-like [Arabidopsis lyrata subsp. lyrata]|uniref:glutathione S-transferase T3-like n=1 Tax=Arabidopsis lyrata subsp. lyrata TaxID=81972 RepID=UPI000A29CC48|nr:glutathione S-transferase T3-like [Arabidopsis lyrata subsp. lyrata]|eukprot:XP_020875124.1 glutathione S-transferase T3-like [Arabidopsis lyrata subsp. lyrata]